MTFKRLASAIALAAMMLASTGKANGQTPRPEYPRPQFERSEWMNLNGTWTYSFDFGKTGEQKGWKNSKGFDGHITVPFCPESSLSGVHHTDFINSIWYQRQLNIPSVWSGKKIMLNFGAVDYEAHIYVDGQLAMQHKGTGSSFSCDITRYVKPGHTHNLVVQVNDNLRSGMQPGGKQCFNLHSEGCMYTPIRDKIAIRCM